MRIALIGDLQYENGEQGEVARQLALIDALHPELAISMGDMGHGGISGRQEGMEECAEMLKGLSCPVVALLGNHDVEYRPDDPVVRTPKVWYRKAFRRETPYQAVLVGEALLLCLSVERQREETLLTQHALYVSDAQFHWAEAQLQKHGGRPTIIVAHAPAPGSHLRGDPPIHAAATDVYLDQNFAPERWQSLLKEYSQIRLWVSAHFHMGHDYPSAITWDGNTAHVSCGVLTSASRDGSRHTRILDIADNRWVVSTFNHEDPKELRADLSLDLSMGSVPYGNYAVVNNREVLIGVDRAKQVYADEAMTRVYIATEYGKLWEYDLSLGELTGAICRKREIQTVAEAQGRLYVKTTDGTVFSVDLKDPMRMERRGGYIPERRREETVFPHPPLITIPFQERMEREGTYLSF